MLIIRAIRQYIIAYCKRNHSLKKWGVVLCIALLAGCHPNDHANSQSSSTSSTSAKLQMPAASPSYPASKSTQAQQLTATEKRRTADKLIAQHSKALFGWQNAIIIGNRNGTITLVEFYDYQCIHCRDMAATILALIHRNPDLRVVLRQLPFMGHYSVLAAKSALAAAQIMPSRFLQFHENLMKAPLPFNSHTLPQVAKAAGYNSKQLLHLAASPQYNYQLEANRQLATTLLVPTLGQIATPVTIIGPTDRRSHYAPIAFIPGIYSQAHFQQAIDAVKQGVCSPATCD
jgi:protein-disulfide isomerase